MSLVVREPAALSSLELIDEQCAAVELWVEQARPAVPEAQDKLNRLAGIDEYLARTSTTGRARVAATMRRLELSFSAGSEAPTMDEAYDILARYPEIRNSLRWQHPPREIALVPSVAVFMHFQLRRLDEAKADTFFSLLYPGDGLPAGHAIGTLRKQLVKYRVMLAGTSPSNVKVMAWTYRGWNHWVNGQRTTTLKWTPDMDFPVPVKPS